MESNRSCPSALARFFPGDFVAASAFFAAFNTGQSVAEFLFNPLLGCPSDNMGRRLFLLAWPPINTLTRLLVIWRGSPRVLFWQQVLVKMLEYTFEKAIACSVSDLILGDHRSVVNGNVSMLKVGLGFLLGAGFVSTFAFSNPRPAYYACASASGLITLLLAGMPETLPVARRQPIQWARTQPLACVQLLRPGSEMNRNSGGAVWRLEVLAAMQKGTNKGVEQQLNVFTKEQLTWTAATLSRYKVVEGLSGFSAGRLVGPLLVRLGKRWAVVVGNMASAVAWLVIGTAGSTAQVLAGQAGMGVFGPYLRPSIETALTKHADRAGVGQGVLQGQLANLVAIVKCAAPTAYLAAYRLGRARGLPALPFALYASFFALSAALFATVPQAAL